ncbi:uncharacterized protein [Taeniopygia guttata]|uniref:uncharacterized protein n=1 Tax=Taeniopygia guttata TaxID=59729 RepID=UPI0011AF6F58
MDQAGILRLSICAEANPYTLLKRWQREGPGARGGRRSQTKPSGAAARPCGPRRGSGPARPRGPGGRRGGGGAAPPGPREGRRKGRLPPSLPSGRGAGATGAAASGRDTPALGRHAAPGAPSPTCSDRTQPGASPYYRPRLIVLPPPPFPRRRLSPRSCQVPPFTWARDGLPLPPLPLRYGRRYANGAPPPPLPPVPTGAAQRPRRNPAPRIPPCAVRTLCIPPRYERKPAIGGRSRVKELSNHTGGNQAFRLRSKMGSEEIPSCATMVTSVVPCCRYQPRCLLTPCHTPVQNSTLKQAGSYQGNSCPSVAF